MIVAEQGITKNMEILNENLPSNSEKNNQSTKITFEYSKKKGFPNPTN